ncbi:amidohydrolase family protein [Actinomadura madurae]|uniref:amidohydrolase family protein n=1 Tax=Actinomadura madurae TaxID=1993 RepID=UPI000D9A8B77|nr:amidohydrolase family protein [Actinomadura madurae]SPT59115.1 Melamine deaminase [Actinomadura madurae]
MTSQADGADECDLVITGALIVTADEAGTVLPGSVAVKDGRIAGLGPDGTIAARYRAGRAIRADGAVLHPGFVDAHMHINQYAARSALPALERAGKTMGHWKARITTADEVASARLAVLDLLRSGHTGFVDPGTVYEPDAVAETASQAGVRAWLTDPYVADRGHDLAASHPELFGGGFLRRWPRTTDEAMARVGGQLFRNRDDGLVQGFVGLYGEASDSPELYRYAAEVARDNGVTVQEHLGYTQSRYIAEEKRYGRTPVQRLADAGLLGEHTSFVHMNRVTAADADLLVRAGASLVWCPYGQMQALSRPDAEPRMPELWRRGTPVGIGSDIARAGGLDALGTLAVSASTMAGDAVRPAEVLRMRGAGAARTVGARGLGEIRPGHRADLVLRWPAASEALGADAALETGVLGACGSVRTVIVDGAVVFEDGRPTRFDAADAVRHARASVRRLLESIG